MESGAIFLDMPLGLDSVEIIALSFFFGSNVSIPFLEAFFLSRIA